MSFELKDTLATFQRARDAILSSVKTQSVIVYLDDVVFFFKKAKIHKAHLQQVLALLRDAAVTRILTACPFFAEKSNYLGPIILPVQLELSAATNAEVCELKHLTTQTELRSSLGFCNEFH